MSLREADAPSPEMLRITAKLVVEKEVAGELVRAPGAGVLTERVVELIDEAGSLGLDLDPTAARPAMSRAVGRVLDALARPPTAERPAGAMTLVQGAEPIGVGVGLWRAQDRVFAPRRDHPDARETPGPLADVLGLALVVEGTR